PQNWIWLPYAIYADGHMVGLLDLVVADPATTDWLFHFFIDQRYQGQGHGRRALAALISFIQTHHPRCQSINLTVHPNNQPAQHLYSRAGFTPTGEMAFGEPVYQLNFQ